jgi:hypothetical protein
MGAPARVAVPINKLTPAVNAERACDAQIGPVGSNFPAVDRGEVKSMECAMLAMALLSSVSACSTAGGMYTEGDPVNGEFSGWKTAGAVLVGILTVGAVGAAAYASASNPAPSYSYTARPVIYRDSWGTVTCRNSETGGIIPASYCL